MSQNHKCKSVRPQKQHRNQSGESAGIRVEICGGIATGKTTLAQACQSHFHEAVFEDFRANPFYEQFYRQPEHHAFETELTFLLQHYASLRDAQARSPTIAADFSIIQDAAYAESNLEGGRLRAFQAVLQQVNVEIGLPHLLIHLHCDAPEARNRIRRRHRAAETDIPVAYIERITQAVAQQVDAVRNTIPILDIDSKREDFSHENAAQQQVAEQVKRSFLTNL